VNENILPTLTADKAVAFGGIEPFHGPNKTFSHTYLSIKK
jgi:hypothetical protein